jgi:fructokinase
MQDWGLDTRGIQRDTLFPTGGVEITMQGTDHQFDIRADQAYDYIDYQLLTESIRDRQPSLIYLGSLIIRNQTSRESLERLLGEKQLPVFVDVNLRNPWWDAATVDGLLSRARWAKLNDEELATIVPGTVHSEEEDLIRAANEALLRFELDAIVVTRGAEGAFITTPDGTAGGKPPPIECLVDTVGAGDAFCAVTLFGLHAGWSASEIIERALTFAAEICRQRGATSSNRELYRRIHASWGIS